MDAATEEVADDHQCSTVCLLTACDLFYQAGGTCYTGRFDHLGGGVLAAPVAGPFHQKQERYGEVQKSISLIYKYDRFFLIKISW